VPALSADDRYCADTFNGAIASAALSAAWEIGLLDELETCGRVNVATFAASKDANEDAIRAILVALSSRRIVRMDDLRHEATTDIGFDSAFRTKGFFYWLIRGCGEMFTTLPTKLRNGDRAAEPVRRDSRAISVACRSIARAFFDPPFRALLDGIDFRKVTDLGCGSADRIVMLAEDRPHVKAIGIDVADGAVAVASEAVAAAGLGDRVTLIQDDVMALTLRADYRDVDLVTCFLMGHDFWPRENAVQMLRRLRETFPGLQNFILGDTCRSTGIDGPAHPMFTLGFETVHAVMEQYLPTLNEWESVLEESGWRIAAQRLIDLPAFSFIYRLVPAQSRRLIS
jgi:SAM-dependent methyltransferase